MRSQHNSLPAGWAAAALGEVADPTRPRHAPQDYPGLPFIGMENVEAHTMKLLGTVPAETMRSSAVHFFPGDVLYGRLRPYLNKVLCPDFEGLCSAEFIVLPETEHIDSKFIQYRLNSADFVSFASHLNTGDRPRVDFEQISLFPMAIPPLPEQRRIVAEIEKQFTRLEAGVAALKRVQANLKRYRAAALKAAVEGRLVPTEAELARGTGTPACAPLPYEPASELLHRILAERRNRWEADQLAKFRASGRLPKDDKWKEKYKEPEAPETTNLPNPPRGWCWSSLGQMYEIKYGLSEPLSKLAPESSEDVPVIRIANITQAGALDLTELKYFTLSEEQRRKLLLRRGDLLFNWRNAPKLVGKTACFDVQGDYVNASFLLRMRPPATELDGRFAWVYINFLRSRGYFEMISNAAVNQSNFNASRTAEVPVPLPPLAEQRRIMVEVERRLSVIDELEMQVAANLKRADRLRQAILKRAFEGNLVPQDPTDEPASVLLERIRAQRTSGPALFPSGTATPGCAPRANKKSSRKLAQRKSPRKVLSS